MPVVAYRKLTVYYKIHAPNSAAINAYEENLMYSGFSIVRAMTNKAKQQRHGVRVEPSTHPGFEDRDLIRVSGCAPFLSPPL